jgi:dTDP-L-rhamnose 4-epimerase
MRVLVTGGAGFIGSHTVDQLAARGHEVTVFDSLEPQVHGGKVPECLSGKARLVVGDVRDRERLAPLVGDTDAILHLASAVGVGQSMYELRRYVDVNSVGTATLLDILANDRHSVRRLVTASSMTLYGEGAALCPQCGPVTAEPRRAADLDRRDWAVHCPGCGAPTAPAPTGENYAVRPQNIYGITKRDQEELSLTVGGAYGIPTLALRYFNAYGPRQALSNPYTGVVAIFAACLLGGRAPVIYEDGLQTRDFVHVFDVARANVLALEAPPEVGGEALNVGSGAPTTLLGILQVLESSLGRQVDARIPGEYRRNDVRHCVADTGRIGRLLGWAPQVAFADGLPALAPWLLAEGVDEGLPDADGALRAHGLVR